ncbi:hypothetical protein PIB30_087979 [Stylosanthes scabra]|uniref:Uncharacterized protein n=1 Tax=Stylosanthes scabra TaxID=79078 RepID=A0ABU6STV8_9FABA|nr:hypothetical protein [Stylosanthes scabra]
MTRGSTRLAERTRQQTAKAGQRAGRRVTSGSRRDAGRSVWAVDLGQKMNVLDCFGRGGEANRNQRLLAVRGGASGVGLRCGLLSENWKKMTRDMKKSEEGSNFGRRLAEHGGSNFNIVWCIGITAERRL